MLKSLMRSVHRLRLNDLDTRLRMADTPRAVLRHREGTTSAHFVDPPWLHGAPHAGNVLFSGMLQVSLCLQDDLSLASSFARPPPVCVDPTGQTARRQGIPVPLRDHAWLSCHHYGLQTACHNTCATLIAEALNLYGAQIRVSLDTSERLPVPVLGSTCAVRYPGDIIRSGARCPVSELSTPGTVATILMDLTIVSVTSPSNSAHPSANAALRAAETSKIARSSASVQTLGPDHQFVALAFTHLGRPSPVAHAHLKAVLNTNPGAPAGFRLLLKRLAFAISAHVASSMQAHTTRVKPLASSIPHGGSMKASDWVL
jgi:hypothetical protein